MIKDQVLQILKEYLEEICSFEFRMKSNIISWDIIIKKIPVLLYALSEIQLSGPCE